MNKSGFVTSLAIVFSVMLMVILIFELHGFQQQQFAFHRVITFYQNALSKHSEKTQ